jgi:hypothetical protein
MTWNKLYNFGFENLSAVAVKGFVTMQLGKAG